MSAATIFALILSLIEQTTKAYALYKTLQSEGRPATQAEMDALFADGRSALDAAEAEVARRGG